MSYRYNRFIYKTLAHILANNGEVSFEDIQTQPDLQFSFYTKLGLVTGPEAMVHILHKSYARSFIDYVDKKVKFLFFFNKTKTYVVITPQGKAYLNTYKQESENDENFGLNWNI